MPLEYEKSIVSLESDWNGRYEDSYGRCGKLETPQACRGGSSHAPWKAKYLEWKSTVFFNRANFKKEN